MTINKKLLAGAIVLGVAGGVYFMPQNKTMATEQTANVVASDILNTYGNIALANFKDSQKSAVALQEALKAYVSNPTDTTLNNAKTAYVKAREIYQQTEAFRFGNPTVDDFEGKVNAWPLDEGLIDYVDSSYGTDSDENPFYTANIIANKTIKVAGKEIDASVIDANLIRKFQEIEEVESNVATGYHAIEFLLWGQDLNGNKPGAGMRPVSDFATGSDCTGGNCDRRGAYLLAAADVLVEDLNGIVSEWETGAKGRQDLEKNGISAIVTGLGSLAYGELAGERTKLGLMLGDPEEEHDCFSDLTHVSHYYDVQGIKNVYYGKYESAYGNSVSGASIHDMIAEKDTALATELDAKISKMMETAKTMYDRAENGEAFDVMIAKGNTAGNKTVQNFVDSLVMFSKSLQKSLTTLNLKGVEFEGSDSLDNPSKVGS